MQSPIQSYLEELHEQLAGVGGGQVASYIPELTKANPNWFGICLVPLQDGGHQRIASLGAGMNFGEMALLGQTTRSASVHADTEVTCRVMETDEFNKLAEEFPQLKIGLLENLSNDLANKLRRATKWIAVLA